MFYVSCLFVYSFRVEVDIKIYSKRNLWSQIPACSSSAISVERKFEQFREVIGTFIAKRLPHVVEWDVRRQCVWNAHVYLCYLKALNVL